MSLSFRPGDVLARRYRLVDLLVESGSGRFWRAHDQVLDRHVAIHVIAADDPRSEALLEAARRSTRVVDRRLLRVLDAAVEGEVCYVVNEWGSGVSLDILVGSGSVLEPRHAAWLVAQLADVLAKAHDRGVSHGRLVPENVLVDQHGEVRVIGLCVDAALHGAAFDRTSSDVADLAGMLYCALTAHWAGPSRSAVRRAPTEHTQVLRPRQVRAGVPRVLDQVCDVVLHPHVGARGPLDEVSAAGIGRTLESFVGEPAGVPASLARTLPPARERFTVTLPPETPQPARPSPAPDPTPDPTPGPPTTAVRPEDVATQASFPALEDERPARRAPSSPPPPRPPDPPARPLFAPDPPEGAPSRRARSGAVAGVGGPAASGLPAGDAGPRDGASAGSGDAGDPSGFWPWDTGPRGGAATDASGLMPAVQDEVPGRSWLRLALVISVLLVVLVAVVVVYNLNRGRTPLGAVPDPTPSASASSPAPSPTPAPLSQLVATDLDPQGDGGEENPAEAPLSVDGDPATSWSTSRYFQQLGPAGLKTGVGLVVDLGADTAVSTVDLSLVGAPTSLTLYTSDSLPTDVTGLDAVAEAGDAGTKATLELEQPVTTRYLVVWLTSLPAVSGGFRGAVAEIGVLGVPVDAS